MKISTNGTIYFDTSNLINVFNAYLNTTNSGANIYFQNLNSQSKDFDSAISGLKQLNSAFNPTNLFRITYELAFSQNFQIILASSSSSSYVLLKYISCHPQSNQNSTPGIYNTFSNGQTSSSSFSNPCSLSNVNLAGTWVFDVLTPSGLLIFI